MFLSLQVCDFFATLAAADIVISLDLDSPIAYFVCTLSVIILETF